jgi:cysteinyl-tRNA synthetase
MNLYKNWQEARASKAYDKADEIRLKLMEKGYM